MLTAISRYGVRVPPTTPQIVAACRERGEFIEGPQIAAFERAFAARLGARHAVSASYGRMAFYFILKALRFPPGSEIVVPALTFWGIPEMARVAGLSVRFADVDPSTFCLDPAAFERAITDRTRAVVPTHLYGLPCDMDAILDVAGRHNLAVVEDCAHALGATYRGRPVGTFGDGALFSFDTFGPLNCCGGGMAVVREGPVATRVREQVEALPWPHERRVGNRLLAGRLRRLFARPSVFTFTGFPILWASSFAGARPDVYCRERIRSLDPLPEEYRERSSNVQATLGLAGLDLLEGWTAATRAHAGALNLALADLPCVLVPAEPAERTHVYSRYPLIGPEREVFVRRCIRWGVDIGTRQADICTQLRLFATERAETPGARRAAEAVQIPVHASLTDRQLRRVIHVVRKALTSAAPDVPASSSQAART
jgi:dTDP-4-amino-4,6-dideoxygalactose transaminase